MDLEKIQLRKGRYKKKKMYYKFLVLLSSIPIAGILLALPVASLIHTGSLG